MISHPPEQEPYQKLCLEIIRPVSLTDRESYQVLMQQLDIGENRPSELYQRMRQLFNNGHLDAFFSSQKCSCKISLPTSNN